MILKEYSNKTNMFFKGGGQNMFVNVFFVKKKTPCKYEQKLYYHLFFKKKVIKSCFFRFFNNLKIF